MHPSQNITSVELETLDFHAINKDQALQAFATDEKNGLSLETYQRRLAEYGENSLGEDTKLNYKAMVIHQICNAMILVLFISMIISFAIRDWITGGVITFVVVINVVIGTYQEYKASKTMNSLKQLSSPNAHIIRNGHSEVVPSKDVVPGDICSIKVGDTVPADLRLISSKNLETDEALLTGESLPVSKDPDAVFSVDTPVGDRINLAFASSTVVKGRGVGIVIKTGLNTEIGKIAKSLKGEEGLVSRNPDKSFLQNAYITFKQSAGAFLGTTVGTPLHQKLSKLALLLFGVAVIFAIVVMASQKFKVDKGIAIYAICVALSMIPSSLVVVLTITMSVGAAVMASRNVIIRKLDSLEALGAVNDICSDKTGTLTQGKMIARRVWVPRFGTVKVENSNQPFNPNSGETEFIPKVSPYEHAKSSKMSPDVVHDFKEKYITNRIPHNLDVDLFKKWLEAATLANIATVFINKENEWTAHGDPTEIAIQVFTTRMDLPRAQLTGEHVHSHHDKDSISGSGNGNEDSSSASMLDSETRSMSSISNSSELSEDPNAQFNHMSEFPFDSTIKRMSAVYKDNKHGTVEVFTKGASERVLTCCKYWYGSPSRELTEITENDFDFIRKNVDELSSEGLRVLGFAKKSFSQEELDSELRERLSLDRDFVESDLIFLGLIGIYDPPRAETAGAVKMFHEAGINVRMLTGDFPGTAKAIAQEVGILPKNLYYYPKEVIDTMVMTGAQFDELTEDEIDALPLLPLVIARCSPQTKVRMIEALHRRDKFCAMTGDGVNDSPSLKLANVGIAMGINGSDVAKEASDIVLRDDNFASILNAVEEGRRMSDNIQKFVLQLLAENVAQALYLIVGLLFIDSNHESVFPLSPVEVLWIIVVTSCFPAMGLGLEKAAPDLMERPPNDSKAGIFTWEVIIDMFVYGIIMAGACMGSFTTVVYGKHGGNLGVDCNNKYNDSCTAVFKGRSAAFATMTWCALILAWEVVDMRRSFFRMHPNSKTPVRQFFKDITSNKFLFWSIMFGFASAFPVVYIPVINDVVFLHKPISYEWGLALAFSAAFWVACEIHKYIKRQYFKGQRRFRGVEEDLEHTAKDPFSKFHSESVTVRENIVLPKSKE